MHLLRRSIALVDMTFLQILHVFRTDAGRNLVATFAVLLSRHVVFEKSEGFSRWTGDDRFFTSVSRPLMKYEGGSNRRLVKYEGQSSFFRC